MRIRWRLPLAFALTTLVFAGLVALVSAIALRGVLLDRLQDDMAGQARQYATVLAVLGLPGETSGAGLTLTDGALLQELTRETGLATGVRFTVIDSEGVVLADSLADPKLLDNHAGRPEVAQALAGVEGRARRKSATLGIEEVYVAIPLPTSEAPWSQGALRVAQPASKVNDLVAAAWQVPLIVWAVLLLPTLVVGYLLTRPLISPLERLQQVTARVASGDFGARAGVRSNDELGALARSFNDMAEQLESRSAELKAESERLQQMLGAMDEGVLLIDGEGRLLRANPAAERILRVGLQGEEGRPLVVTARAFPASVLAERAWTAGRAIAETLELPDSRWLGVEVVPLLEARARRPEDRSARHTLFVVRDETERRRTEQMRRDFVTNVSHELKTPLAGLSLLADTLQHAIREDPAAAERFAQRLTAEIEHLTELTTDLLTLSRLEEPEPTSSLLKERVELKYLAEAAAEEIRPVAEAKRHRLTVDTSGAQKAVVIGDEVSLRTMLRNLLDNAVRYTEPGGHINLVAKAETDAAGRLWGVLQVTDDGVGIPLADQQRIFERFYRVDKARSRQTGGTGLGLSIVKHVAERHGGRVEVKSTLGVGSTFTVRLPAVGE